VARPEALYAYNNPDRMPEQPGVLASPSDLGVYVRCKQANSKQQTAAVKSKTMCCSASRAKRSKRLEATTKPRRPQKNKLTGLGVVGWFLKKIPGLVSFFPPRFFLVFFYSPHRKTPKNVINKSRKKSVSFCRFFSEKVFDRTSCKYICLWCF
jgi:hypothetical protein